MLPPAKLKRKKNKTGYILYTPHKQSRKKKFEFLFTLNLIKNIKQNIRENIVQCCQNK